jgi:lipid-binding SYLF domain-containing protein
MKRFLLSLCTVVCLTQAFTARAGEFLIQRRVGIATSVVSDLLAHAAVPPQLVSQAQCVAQITQLKGGFIFGGEGGTGLVSCRIGREWSEPLFLNVGGASVGFQIGGQAKDVVLVFLTNDAVSLLSRPRLELGGDIGIAAGPIGASAGAGLARNTEIVAYAKSGGLFAGITAEQVVVWPFELRNQVVYGAHSTPAEILSTPARLAPAYVGAFTQALQRYAPALY